MRLRYVLFSALAGLVLAACTDQPAGPESADGPELRGAKTTAQDASLGSVPTTDRHLVVFKGKRGVPDGFDEEVSSLGGTVAATYEAVGGATVDGLDDAGARELGGHRRVRIVEPEVALQVPEPQVEPVPEEAGGAEPVSAEEPSAATFFPRQWNMRAIDADDAWAEGALGSSDVTVAILDTGIGYTHPDLQGLVDLTRSVSFIPEDDALVDQVFPDEHPITDLHYHGTHVAATVASNAQSAAGVTSRTTLIGAKVCSVLTGLCPTGAVFAGVMHAADAGADIANLSLGGSFEKREFPGFVAMINRVFNYAHGQGTQVVVAAGNDATDLDGDGNAYQTYCDTPHNACVSATGPTDAGSVDGPFENVDALAGYSNFGRSAVDVAAPGGNAESVWAACSPTSLVVTVCQTGTFVLGISGTSMASPHAAGVAALVAADGARKPAQIRDGLLRSVDDLGQPGTDPAYGKGRVNALRAVR